MGSVRDKKGSRKFFIAAICIFMLGAAATTAGLFMVYELVEAYEKSQPLPLVESVAELFSSKNAEGILNIAGISLSRYETAEHFMKRLEADAGDLTSIRVVRRREDSYDLAVDQNIVATVTLKGEQQGKFDMPSWSIADVKLSASQDIDAVIDAPAGAEITVNGIAISGEDIVSEAVPVDSFGALPNGISPAQLTRVRISGLFVSPEVSASNEGLTCEVEKAEEENYYRVISPAPDSLKSVIAPLAESASRAYASFVTNDAALDDVLPYFLYGTEFYVNLTQFYNGWYIPHDKNEFRDLAISGFDYIDQSHIICEVEFTYVITMGWRVFEYPTNYTLCFVNTGGEWKVANLLIGE